MIYCLHHYHALLHPYSHHSLLPTPIHSQTSNYSHTVIVMPEPSAGIKFLHQYFSVKDANNQRSCLMIANSGQSSSFIGDSQPRRCSDKLSCTTSSGNLAKHIFNHNNPTINHELLKYYPEVSNKRKRDDRQQPTLRQSFIPLDNAQLATTVAICFAALSLPRSLADNPLFRSMMAAYRRSTVDFPHRRSIGTLQSQHRQSLEMDIIKRVAVKSRASPVTIAFDGWTNVRHVKVTNVTILCDGVAYYWRSYPSLDGRGEAEFLMAPIQESIQSMIKNEIVVAALSADNESVNKSLFNIVHDEFPQFPARLTRYNCVLDAHSSVTRPQWRFDRRLEPSSNVSRRVRNIGQC